ncbi:hypothetical protein V6N13_051778 [Hibiscus sabdariffa]|uniref:Uncharacterized protein n=1 Tax=Hibiscus sabdariffa TaxID=183260 RepID=A0ABR2T4F6_9ROSI
MRQCLGNARFLSAPFDPRNELGAAFLYAEVPTRLISLKPGGEGQKSHVHESDAVASEVELVSELGFQRLQALDQLLLRFRLVLLYYIYPLAKPRTRPVIADKDRKEAAATRDSRPHRCIRR